MDDLKEKITTAINFLVAQGVDFGNVSGKPYAYISASKFEQMFPNALYWSVEPASDNEPVLVVRAKVEHEGVEYKALFDAADMMKRKADIAIIAGISLDMVKALDKLKVE